VFLTVLRQGGQREPSVDSLLRDLHSLNRSVDYSVMLQMRLARKRYLKSKRVYEYERISLHIPKKFHKAIKPYLEQDLDLKVTVEKDSLVVTLTPLKTLRHAANDPTETQQKASGQT